MNWIEIIRLIVQLWPLIEKILGQIENAGKKKEAEKAIAQVFGNIIKDKIA